MNLNGGYAMIKYNSTQEELAVAYKSKRPALFYDENQRAHWAVIEETATQSVDEETQEPITLYEYSYRLLDAGGSGGKLYLHMIELSLSGDSKYSGVYIELYSSNSTPYTYEELFLENVNNIPCTTTMASNNSGYLGTRFAAFQNEFFIGGIYVLNGTLSNDNVRININKISHSYYSNSVSLKIPKIYYT